ncbi:MAG: hydroxymethylbilane synthase [Acidobacteriota bacterium]
MSVAGTAPLVIGTRGSQLALWQARHVASCLESIPRVDARVFLKIIRTSGDRDRARSAAGFSEKGIFVREIEEALLNKEIDLAVHSMKDLPSTLPAGLSLVAFPLRADVRDALVTSDGRALRDLPDGAVVGTGSLRRRAQLLRARPDLTFIEMRGNVDTRLAKLAGGEANALVLAMAGLTRLGLGGTMRRPLSTRTCLPAPCQGALALEARQGDDRVRALAAGLDHVPTRQQVEAERVVLAELDAGCLVPLGTLARHEPDGESLSVVGRVVSPAGDRVVEARVSGPAAESAALGHRLADELRAAGADEILERPGAAAGGTQHAPD